MRARARHHRRTILQTKVNVMVPRILCIGLALAVGGACGAAPGATGTTRAGDACESAVAEAVREARGRDAHEVEFIGAKRALSTSPGDQTGVKGEGRYRARAGRSVAFTYSCAFDAARGGTHGVMFIDKAGAPPGPESGAIDLGSLTPETCEAATAARLKLKHPRVDRIRFDADSRALRPLAESLTLLEGRGALTRAPGMNAVAFTYGCEFENRSGRVVGVRTSE